MKERKWLRATLALSLFLSACARDAGASDATSVPVADSPQPIPSQVADYDEVGVDVVDSFLEEQEPDDSFNLDVQSDGEWIVGLPTIEPPTMVPELLNPWEDVVFNQRCKIYDENNKVVFNCTQKWAETPLPGGCKNQYRNYMGSSSCNATSTSYVLNELVPPDVFVKLVGQPGITPDVLISDIYPNLPEGKRVVMTCYGAGPVTMKAAFDHFGLKYRDVLLSEYTVADVVRGLKPNERLMVALIGTNAKGRRFQHWSVAAGVGEVNGHESVYYHDSYFYLDPADPNYDTVFFEQSANIMSDPTRYTGKKFDYVGAMIVYTPDSFEGVGDSVAPGLVEITDYQTTMVADDARFDQADIQLDLDRLQVAGNPIAVGKDRYRVAIKYRDESYDFYYFDQNGGSHIPPLNKQLEFEWGDYIIPLYRQQDPRWGGKLLNDIALVGGKIPLFGIRGCGQTVAASVISMFRAGTQEQEVTPFEINQKYFSTLTRGGTYANDYLSIFEDYGISVTPIVVSVPAIEKAIDEGKMVMVQGAVDFKWWYGGKEMVDHFVLVLGRDTDGKMLIHDPYWGPFVTKISDIDLSKSTGVLAIEYPNR